MPKEIEVRGHHVWLISGLFSLLTACSLVIDADPARLTEHRGASSPTGGDGDGDDTPGGSGPCADDADCSDADPCSGEERCAPDDARSDERGCLAGAPLDCSDD